VVMDNDSLVSRTIMVVHAGSGPVNEPPNADFVYSITPLENDTFQVQFNSTSTDSDGDVIGWLWEFGDGTLSLLENVTHNYTSAGTYTVNLTITDDDGATDSASQSITVGTPVRIRITHHYGNTSAYNGVPMFDIETQVPEGSTPLDVLQSVADVTMYEGRVYSINGITESPPYYWYLWINGIPAPEEDIDSYQLRDGEIIHWDYTRMINAGNETTQFRPRMIMDFPEPFLHGYGGGGGGSGGVSATASQSTVAQPTVSQSTDWEILQIKVVNNGTGDANNFEVEVLLDGVSYATTTVSVCAKAYRLLYLSVPKGCNVSVRLDTKNVVAETNEANNEATKSS
ncbi:MAG TPA: hypothetical protein C5S37_09315, partial [Methanophagales archaeon]|nr:hypothetical protein [Methanophagales archaeon]